MSKYSLWTDGSAQLNKAAGCAFVLVRNKNGEIIKQKSIPILDGPFTAPYAELQAVLRGVKYIQKKMKDKPKSITIHSDSQYVVNTINGEFKLNKYKEDFKVIMTFIKEWPRNVTVEHVRAHVGLEYNELADKLAGAAKDFSSSSSSTTEKKKSSKRT